MSNLRKYLTRAELALLCALLLAVLLTALAPPIAQHAHYHAFADQRGWHGLPCALDVLSNVGFVLAGLWGMAMLWQLHRRQGWDAHSSLAAVFFVGLLVTAVGSTYYHLQPNDARLVWDRLGMVAAFAGLLGLAAADRVSARAGCVLAGFIALVGPASVLEWNATANLTPWVVLQGGGMVLLLVLGLRRPLNGGWHLPVLTVVGIYALAKALELGDHWIYAVTQGWVSGHSLKHVVAAMAAWPVLRVMHNVARVGTTTHRRNA